MKPLNLPTRKRARGNPDWFKLKPAHALPTEFEAEVARLGLTKSELVASTELKRWCDRNRNRVYIPEWLLADWGMHVDVNSAA